MGGGIVRGLVSGLIVSLVLLAVLSLSMPLPDRSAPPESAAPQPQDIAPVIPAPDAGDAAPLPSDSMPLVDPDPAAVPEGSAPAAPEPGQTLQMPPAPPAESAVPAQPVAEPAEAAPVARLPQVGGEAEAPRPASVPPVAPVLGTTSDPVVPMDEPAPTPSETVAAALPQPQPQPVPVPLPIAPSPRFITTADADTDAGGIAPRRIPAVPSADQLGRIDTTPPAPAALPAMPTPALDPLSEAAPNEAAQTGAEAAPAPRDRPSLPQIVAPSRADSETAPAPPSDVSSMVAAEAEPPMDTDVAPAPIGALFEHAAGFDVPSDQPIMAVVLIEDPANPLDPAILEQISFPVSFALDPLAAESPARAAQLRAAGFEVVILAAGAIPLGATASDVEVALGAARDALPQAVAMMDDPDARIQADRPVLEATVAALAESGHGLIAFPRGLNAAETTAQRAGLGAATAFRVLDDEDQRAPLITRYLDRAAFAAGQTGAVIVVGRIRPDTITAVFSWALSGRVEAVQLAPVSAVLQRAID